MAETRRDPGSPPRHSASADAAALRWSETHPDDDVSHPPPTAPSVAEDGVPNRHSASAESAAERVRERADERADD
jgi:hypothetical protein